MHQDPKEGAVTSQKTESKPPASVGGSPVETWVGRGSPQGWGTDSRGPGRPRGPKPPCALWLLLSHIRLFATSWTITRQTSLSVGILQAKTLEWVVMPSSRGSSQLRNWIQVSHIADGFFIVWVTREALFEVPINPTIEASRPQGWVTSGQATYREGAQFHPWADNLIKALLSKALHTR